MPRPEQRFSPAIPQPLWPLYGNTFPHVIVSLTPKTGPPRRPPILASLPTFTQSIFCLQRQVIFGRYSRVQHGAPYRRWPRVAISTRGERFARGSDFPPIHLVRSRPPSILADMAPEVMFDFAPPVNATLVSSEETQARLDEIRHMPWIEPNYTATTVNNLQVVERYWRRYVHITSPADEV